MRQFCSAFNDIFGIISTVFAGQHAREWLLPRLPRVSAPAFRDGGHAPLREALCLPLPRSSSLPSFSQRWAEAASFLHCVDDGARGVLAPCFRITRSLRILSRRGARRCVPGAAGGSSVNPNTGAPVDCSTLLAALTERR